MERARGNHMNDLHLKPSDSMAHCNHY